MCLSIRPNLPSNIFPDFLQIEPGEFLEQKLPSFFAFGRRDLAQIFFFFGQYTKTRLDCIVHRNVKNGSTLDTLPAGMRFTLQF